MRICKKCSKTFPSTIVIDGKERKLNNRSYCLECSPFGNSNGYVLRKERTKGKKFNADFKICVICEKQYKRNKNNVCPTCRTLYRRNRNKKIAIDMLGGKCSKCGIEDLDCLAFHHINPEEKSFTLAWKWSAVSWKEILEELKKCELLCSNCHVKHHKEETKEKLNKIEEYYLNANKIKIKPIYQTKEKFKAIDCMNCNKHFEPTTNTPFCSKECTYQYFAAKRKKQA